MTSKAPPAPPENESHKGTGEAKTAPKATGQPSKAINPDKLGHQANSKVNTTNQGYQQDR
jgi:hypothetical protein